MSKTAITPSSSIGQEHAKFSWHNIKKDFIKNWPVYAMVIPSVTYFIIFHYMPMGGLLMAFERYQPNKGLLHSQFVGLKNFMDFFSSVYCWRVIRNTLILSLLQLCIEFPFTILFALLLNEIAHQGYKRTIQTISYMPNFISMVVIAGIIVDFCASDGAITSIVSLFTGNTTNLLAIPGYCGQFTSSPTFGPASVLARLST